MKKILFLLSLLTLSAILILGCKDPNNPNPNNQTDDDDNLEQRLALIQGEYKSVEINKPNYHTSETNIKIENNYFIDGDGRSFEIKTIKELRNEIDSNIITIIDADNYPSDTLCFIEPRWHNIVSLLTKDNSYLLRTRIIPKNPVEFDYRCYEKIVSGNNPSGESVTLEGQYKIDQANNSTINFNNGSWTFSYNGQTKSGTYSQSGNELTMTFSQNGISATGVFTVTKSGDTITLTGKSGDCVTIISSAFMINDYNALQNQTVTLTVN